MTMDNDIKAAFGVMYWFCVDIDGTPLIFDFEDEPDRIDGRGWSGEFLMNRAISSNKVSKELLRNTNWDTDPVEVVFSPFEQLYYRYDAQLEALRAKTLFNNNP